MISQQTDSLIDDFVEQSKEILRDNLVGVYLHGSLVMGCFNPQKSDIDLIIVVDEPLSDSVKRKYMDMVVEANSCGPAKGIEMSVVLRKVCKPFVYPTPFELHFSSGHLEWYREDPDDYIRKMNGTDKDLAAHFTIINSRGKCLYGTPIREVFAEVPKRDYMDSIWFDVEGAVEEITDYPMYFILNLPRVLAYKEDGLVLSKKEGGEWALKHLPSKYHPLIIDAMREYSEGEEVVYNDVLAKRYVEYVIGQITQ
jgi:streptomycin 3"-adenylyltransferase